MKQWRLVFLSLALTASCVAPGPRAVTVDSGHALERDVVDATSDRPEVRVPADETSRQPRRRRCGSKSIGWLRVQ